MKNLRNILLIVLLAAVSSSRVVAMKRKAEGDLQDNVKRQMTTAPVPQLPAPQLPVPQLPADSESNDDGYEEQSDDEALFKQARQKQQEEKEMDALTLLLQATNPSIQESIQDQITCILQGKGGHLELQGKLNQLCVVGDVAHAKTAMSTVFNATCSMVWTMPFEYAQKLFDGLENADTIRIALILAYAKIHKKNIHSEIDAVYFVTNLDCMVDLMCPTHTSVFLSEAFLEDVLRLLEPLMGKEIKTLNLAGKGLTYVTPEIRLFSGLEVLELSNNDLTELPQEIGVLGQLTVLRAENNKIAALPQSMAGMVNLERLSLGCNCLTQSGITPLARLKLVWLDLDGN